MNWKINTFIFKIIISFFICNVAKSLFREKSFDNAFNFPGFVPAYIRPLFCEGIGPFRWVALSGDPEDIYREVFASEPEGRVRLLGEVADTLVVEPEIGLAWITVPPGALERHGLNAEHLEGVVELPRSIRGVRLALLFRQLANRRIKVSFRSMGSVNAAELAEHFGGGGHRKAAGASLAGELSDVQDTVLTEARAALE